MIFDEAILYKDKDSSFKAKKPEVIPLKDLPEIEYGNSGTKDQETEAPEESKTTPIVTLRRSSRVIRPPARKLMKPYKIGNRSSGS